MLAAQQACLDAVKPGADFHDYHKVAERVLAQGYIDLGLVQGHARRGAGERQLQAVLHAPRRPLARHGRARRRPLSGEGRVAEARCRAWCSRSSPAPTSGRADNVPEQFWDIGVRIEDDVLVTATGIENLTRGGAEDGGRRRGRLPALVAIAVAHGALAATAMHDVVHRRRRTRRRDARARAAPTPISTSSSLDARARGRDAARRPLARAVARRAAHLRAPRRLGARSRRRRARSRRSPTSTSRRRAASA